MACSVDNNRQTAGADLLRTQREIPRAEAVLRHQGVATELIEDLRVEHVAALIDARCRRGQPQKHLLGPFVEITIIAGVELGAVGWIDRYVEEGRPGYEPTVELARWHDAGRIGIGRQDLRVGGSCQTNREAYTKADEASLC